MSESSNEKVYGKVVDYKGFRQRVKDLLLRMERKKNRTLASEEIYGEVLKWFRWAPSSNKRSILKSEIREARKEHRKYMSRIEGKIHEFAERVFDDEPQAQRVGRALVRRWFLNGWLSTSEPTKAEAVVRVLIEKEFVFIGQHEAEVSMDGEVELIKTSTGGTDQG